MLQSRDKMSLAHPYLRSRHGPEVQHFHSVSVEVRSRARLAAVRAGMGDDTSPTATVDPTDVPVAVRLDGRDVTIGDYLWEG